MAALFAACAIAPGCSARSRASPGEPLELPREVVVARLVRGGEVGPDAGELPALGRRAAQGARLVGVLRAEPPHAAVELHVHPGARARGVEQLLGPDGDVGVRLQSAPRGPR